MSDIVKDFDRFLTEWVNRAHEERREVKEHERSEYTYNDEPYAYFRGKCDTLEIVRMKWKEYLLAERETGAVDE